MLPADTLDMYILRPAQNGAGKQCVPTLHHWSQHKLGWCYVSCTNASTPVTPCKHISASRAGCCTQHTPALTAFLNQYGSYCWLSRIKHTVNGTPWFCRKLSNFGITQGPWQHHPGPLPASPRAPASICCTWKPVLCTPNDRQLHHQGCL